jgi:hypothetical protein
MAVDCRSIRAYYFLNKKLIAAAGADNLAVRHLDSFLILKVC